MLTYDVDIWSVRHRKGRSKAYELRWRVGPRSHSRSFKLKAQADGRRSELMSALRDRQQFDVETGLPADELAVATMPTWYDHASDYVLMKWPTAAAKHRAGIAESLSVVTPILVTSSRGAPSPALMRRALYGWAFRAVANGDGTYSLRHDTEDPPSDIADALTWLANHSLAIDRAADPTHLRPALDALTLRLDGKKASENTVRRKRMVLNNAWRFAVEEKGYLPANPLLRIDWTPPDTEDEVDFRYVPGPSLSRSLIQAVADQGERGRHMKAFFGCLYYAAMRPSEIASLTKTDCRLPAPADQGTAAWGELVLSESRPEVGAGWTDDGKSYDQRGLKRRARRATRPVPIPPALVRLLQDHIDHFGVAADGRLFRAARGGRVRSTEYSDLWAAARKAVLSDEAATPMAEVPYSLRHAGVSLWIKSGVDPAEVAHRAGHSIAVLYRFYAKLLRGNQSRVNELIDRGLTERE